MQLLLFKYVDGAPLPSPFSIWKRQGFNLLKSEKLLWKPCFFAGGGVGEAFLPFEEVLSFYLIKQVKL